MPPRYSMDIISKGLMLSAGLVMVISSTLWLDKLSVGTGITGYNILSAHWWVMFIVGLLLCAIAVLERSDKNLNSKLARMTSDLKRLKDK